MRCEAGVGRKGAGRPFPDIAPAECLRALQRGGFPFGFGGQPAAGPGAPGQRFVLGQEAGGQGRVQVGPAAVAPLLPGLAAAAQVARRGGLGLCQPGATGRGPPAGLGVAAGLDERQEFRPAPRLLVDPERSEMGIVSGEFVVEGEARALDRSQAKAKPAPAWPSRCGPPASARSPAGGGSGAGCQRGSVIGTPSPCAM